MRIVKLCACAVFPCTLSRITPIPEDIIPVLMISNRPSKYDCNTVLATPASVEPVKMGNQRNKIANNNYHPKIFCKKNAFDKDVIENFQTPRATRSKSKICQPAQAGFDPGTFCSLAAVTKSL